MNTVDVQFKDELVYLNLNDEFH